MEAFEETAKEGTRRAGSFIDHVFRLDEQQKGVVINIVQYTLLAFIPIVIVLYLIRTYVPDPDEHKGSALILGEVVGQVMFMFLAIYFIHRIITYIPTYSGYRYGEFNFITVILGLLMIVLSTRSKLGEKVQIIVERVQDLWNGEGPAAPAAGNGGGGAVRVTQPLPQQYAGGVSTGPIGGGMMPAPPALTAVRNGNAGTADYGLAQAQQQNAPNFNNNYAHAVNQGGASMGGLLGGFEPMAANEFGGFTKF